VPSRFAVDLSKEDPRPRKPLIEGGRWRFSFKPCFMWKHWEFGFGFSLSGTAAVRRLYLGCGPSHLHSTQTEFFPYGFDILLGPLSLEFNLYREDLFVYHRGFK
jgi:hypothetical protein